MLRQSVHAYLSSAAAGTLVELAFGDRRLLKMELTRLPGGLVEARDRYSTENSPSLLVLEATAPPAQLIFELEALAEVCVAGTNLILLGTTNDVGLYRDLIRRGVAEYLVLPSEPIRLIDAVLELYRDSSQRVAGQVVAFIGTRGGCGSSTLAANTAWQLARRGTTDVVLIDLDLAFGGADLALNLDAVHGIQAVLADPERIDDQFLGRFTAKYGERLHLLPAGVPLEKEVRLSSVALETTLTALRRQAHFIVLDLPRQWSEWVRQTLHTADHVVVTAEPDLLSVRNGRNLIDFLAAKRHLDQPPLLALNRTSSGKKGEIAQKDFAETIGLEPTAIIAEDVPTFSQAAAAGRLLEETNRRARSVEAIEQLIIRIAGNPAKASPPPPATLKGLLNRLLGKR